MASIKVLKARFNSYDKMYSHDLREQTFADWPFREECSCTPEKVRKLLLNCKMLKTEYLLEVGEGINFHIGGVRQFLCPAAKFTITSTTIAE